MHGEGSSWVGGRGRGARRREEGCSAEQLRLAPSQCCYLGDDLRDIQAAKAAGMFSVAVEYGYSGTENGGPRGWNAEAVIGAPLELLPLL